MVISSTRTVEIIIQALSPLLGTIAGAAGAAAARRLLRKRRIDEQHGNGESREPRQSRADKFLQRHGRTPVRKLWIARGHSAAASVSPVRMRTAWSMS